MARGRATLWSNTSLKAKICLFKGCKGSFWFWGWVALASTLKSLALIFFNSLSASRREVWAVWVCDVAESRSDVVWDSADGTKSCANTGEINPKDKKLAQI